MAESHCDELGETLEEVKLKLALWDGNVEFAELVDAWRAQQFEQLDVTTMEEAVSRCTMSFDALRVDLRGSSITCRAP